MDAEALTESPPVTVPEWRRVALPLAAGLLLLGLIFRREVAAAVQTWDASTAYNHCFLIIPIVLYLLWDRRVDLEGIPARPMPSVLLLGIPLAAVWLLAERLGIMEGRQLAAVSFAEVMLLAVLGRRLFAAMAGPLLYLYFLVPFGEFMTPKLQDVTTWFIRQGVTLAGIPAYIDGYIIEIPQGTFFVAEACAGLRFLIASIAFGCLYALLMYRSTLRRSVFILVSLVVPIVANGFRGFGIVWLGYMLGSAEAAAADHIIYGWLFFSAVILVLILLGLPFRQDDQPTGQGRPLSGRGRPASRRALLATAAGAVLVAAISPAIATGMASAADVAVVTPAALELGAGCTPISGAEANPATPNVRVQRVVCGQYTMDLAWEAFSPRATAAPLMAERRRLCLRAETEGLQESWLDTKEAGPSAWRIMRSNDPAYLTAVSLWVDGAPVRPGLAMRARMAIDSLIGSAHRPMVMTVTPVADWDALTHSDRTLVDASLGDFLRAYPGLTERMGAISAIQ
jgi:exosortase A